MEIIDGLSDGFGRKRNGARGADGALVNDRVILWKLKLETTFGWAWMPGTVRCSEEFQDNV